MPAEKMDSQHATRLATNLNLQRESGKHCDVCVCVSDKRFLAHKCVLSASSAKLDALILDAIGHNSSSQDIEIEIQGVSPVGFEKLLDYFYLGKLCVEQHTVMPVWMTAAYLELTEVVTMCNEFCQQSVSPIASQHMIEDTKNARSMSHNSYSGKKHENSLAWTEDMNGMQEYATDFEDGNKNQNNKSIPAHRVGQGFSQDEKIECESIMAEVVQLRQQHQQLQRLQQEQARIHGGEVRKRPQQNTTIKNEQPEVKRSRRKKAYSSHEDETITVQVTSNTPVIQTPPQVSPVPDYTGNRLPPDFRLIDTEYCQSLYTKYPHVKKEAVEITNCSALDLLDKSKARKRKSVEQNTLNNVVRMILDTIKIVDSTDPRVEDALFLIMDHFDCLRASINDPTVRRSLLVKVKHSIHCKKWRVKQSLNKSLAREAEINTTPLSIEDSFQ